LKKTLSIKFYSDFICPWCYLGKVRFQRIRKELEGEIDIKVKVMPYLLYPHIGPGGAPKSEFAKNTKPGMGRSLREEAKLEGININYKLIDRIPYSMEAHRLVWLIENDKLKYSLSTRLFHDYFEKGQNIEDRNYLTSLATEFGVKPDVIQSFQENENGLKECQQSIEDAKDSFIQLVPTMAFANDLRIIGLQSGEVLKRYLIRASRM